MSKEFVLRAASGAIPLSAERFVMSWAFRMARVLQNGRAVAFRQMANAPTCPNQ